MDLSTIIVPIYSVVIILASIGLFVLMIYSIVSEYINDKKNGKTKNIESISESKSESIIGNSARLRALAKFFPYFIVGVALIGFCLVGYIIANMITGNSK